MKTKINTFLLVALLLLNGCAKLWSTDTSNNPSTVEAPSPWSILWSRASEEEITKIQEEQVKRSANAAPSQSEISAGHVLGGILAIGAIGAAVYFAAKGGASGYYQPPVSGETTFSPVYSYLWYPRNWSSDLSGCCSWHGGVCGCEWGRAKCCDGILSPSCGC